MGILLKTLRFLPVAAVICASSMLVPEAAFASDDLSRILGNTEEPFAMCMQRCDEQTSLGRMSRRGCVPGCEQTRRNFSLRGRSFRTFQRCAEAVERVLLNRSRTIQREQEWCRDNFTHLHHLRGCLDAVNVFYQNVSVESICGRNPARPAATPPVAIAPVPGATPGLVVARGPQPAATSQGAGQAKATTPARAPQAVAGTAAPMLQDTPKYQTKSSSKKGKAGAAKAMEKAPAKVPGSGNGTAKKQPAVKATGKGLKAKGTNGTQAKEKDAPFTPPAVNLEGVVPAPSAPVKAPAAQEKAPSAALQAPSAPAPQASGAAPALPVQVTNDSATPAGILATPAASTAPVPVTKAEPPTAPLSPSAVQPAPVLTTPFVAKAPEVAEPLTTPAPSVVASVPATALNASVITQNATASSQNATEPVPLAPYVPLPEATAVKGEVQKDDPLPLLPELSRADPPTELPPSPAKDMELPSINPLLK